NIVRKEGFAKMKPYKIIYNKNDEYYTPSYAIEPILPFIPKGSKVWCPFDTCESNYVKLLREHGCEVVHTHISLGEDFFNQEVPSGTDFIVSNPPYSLKNEVFERLFKLEIPFAMLVGLVGIFESQLRFNLFKNNGVEVMYFNKRVAYLSEYGG